MRFLILTQYFPPEIGASQVRLAALSRELVRLGHEVEVVTGLPNHPIGSIFPAYRGRFYCREIWEGIPVHRVWLYPSVGAGLKRMLNYASFTVTCLWALFRAATPDYLFVESPPLFLSIPASLFSRLRRIPFIFNVADLWPDSARDLGLLRNGTMLRWAEALERWTYQRADLVNAVTEGIRATLVKRKGVTEERILFLPNGVDLELFAPRQPDRVLLNRLGLESKKVVLYAGTHGYAHALDKVLEAAVLLQKDSAVHFLFVGDGSEKTKLVSLADERGLTNVSFLDPVPITEMPAFFSIAFCGLVPQRDIALFEGNRPSKMFPIMASGRPVVFSGRGEGARLVEQAKAGLVVPPEDPVALAEAIRKLVNQPDLAEEFGCSGRRFAEAHLGWSVLVKQWLSQLESKKPLGLSCRSYP